MSKEKKQEKLLDQALMKELEVDQQALKQMKKKLAKIEAFPERGIETWFRLASKNLYTRRQIVDTKSNILITINSIIISVILGSLYTQMDDDPHLIWGVGPMVMTNLLSITFAILATRPQVKSKVFSKETIENKTAYLMTFDDFYKMSAQEYEWAIGELMKDRELLYGTIKRDVYQLGIDLQKRYRYIHTAYNIFLLGLTVSVFLFGACHVLY